jgi:hypothetical protein
MVPFSFLSPHSLNRCHLFCVLLAHGKKRTLPRATALEWGLFFLFFKKTTNPTRKGSVREPGSLTHPLVTPIEALIPLC